MTMRNAHIRSHGGTGLSLVFLLYACVRLTAYFIPSDTVPGIVMDYACAALLLLLVGLSFASLKVGARRVLVVLGMAGTILLIHARAPLSTWVNAILSNGNLLAMFILVPMISMPFYYEDYQKELENLARLRMRNVFTFLLLVAVSTHVMSVIISIGASLIIFDLLSPYAKLYGAEDPFLRTLSRAYNSSGFYSPAWASVLVYSVLPEVSWVRVIPVGILFTVLFLGLHFLLLFLETRRHPDRYPDIEPEEGISLRTGKLYTMLALAVLMILSIVLISRLTDWDLMICVSVASVLFPLLCALFQRKMPAYADRISIYYRKDVPKVKGQIALFMMAGFFGKALSVSGAGKLIAGCIPESLAAWPVLMIAVLMLVLILPSLAGIHPAATGSALLGALTPAAVGLPPYSFALAILVGWLLTIMVAPYSASALIFSGLTGKSNYHCSIGINWAFALLCIAVFSVLISLIGPLMA